MIIALLWWILAESSHEVAQDFHIEDFTSLFKDRFVWVLTFIIVACMGSYDTLATWMPKVLELKAYLKYPALFLSLGFLVSGPRRRFKQPGHQRGHEKRRLVFRKINQYQAQ